MQIGAGRFKGRRLPRVRAARPVGARLKKSLFDILRNDLEGARVLDLFCGVGALGLEALSRGAAHVTFVDVDGGALSAIGAFVDEVGAGSEAGFERRDLVRHGLPAGAFDLVFLDPPFALWSTAAGSALLLAARERLSAGGRLVVKRPRQGPKAAPEAGWLRRTEAGDVEAALFGPA